MSLISRLKRKSSEKSTGSDETAAARTSWHAKSVEEVYSLLGAGSGGLTDEQVRESIVEYGQNVIMRNGGDGAVKIFLKQLNNPIIGVLVLSALLAFFFDPHGGTKNAAVITAVVILNSLIGFLQEFRADRAIRALSSMVPQTVNALRNGKRISVSASDIAVKDIVFLNSGDRIPADTRLIETSSFRTDESALTGESLPVEKKNGPVASDAGIGDRTCMAYAGTFVTYGSATGIVVATGMNTELGRISSMIGSTESIETPLSKSLSKIGKGLAILGAVLSVVILAIGVGREVAHGAEYLDAFKGTIIFAVALAVGAIPEGLPAMVTVILAFGVLRMAKKNAIIRHLPAVETLGSTTVICTDKTGTLTKNRMTLSGTWLPDKGADKKELLRAAVLCSDATIEREGDSFITHGDPTEGAIVEGAIREGYDPDQWRREFPRDGLIPFESDYQYMAVASSGTVYVKGSPEAVLSRCALKSEETARAENAVHDFAEKGMRVLAVASVNLGGAALTHEAVEKGLTFTGLVAMIDPPRPEVIEAVRAARDAGITVKMITGDHRKTAAAIGGQIGLGGEGAVDGSELAAMKDDAFTEAAVKTNIFARVAPEHKLRLVRTLQHGGQIVAMTGDGVNDAPALKQADIGVAMGITGTSVSKEASDMVLLDDNFATIKTAIEEGRRIYDNLIKSLSFLLPTNLCFAFLFAWAVAFFPFHPATNELIVPLSPVLLFWINLISSLMLGTPLAFEPADADIMRRPPRRPDAPVLGRALAVRTVLIGAVMAASCIAVFLRQYDQFLLSGMGHELATAKAQTMALNTIVMLQLWYLFESRSLRRTMFELNPFSNPAVWIGAGLLISLQIMITHVPVMNAVFGTVPLSLNEWLTTLIFGVAVIPVTVIEKVFVFRIMKR